MRIFFLIGLLFFISFESFAQVEVSNSSKELLDYGLQERQPPIQFDVPQFGSIDFRTVISGIGMAQTNPTNGDYNSLVDISNAQIILRKDSGFLQFYIQSGYYSTPSLGTSYQRAAIQTKDSFGLIPLASLSIAPSQNWVFTAGKINSFGGYENTFSFQNINIDRGLLWNQTSNVSKGFQVSYKENALSSAITLNDGFYSNQLSWMGASLNYQLDHQNSAGVVWTGAIKSNSTNSFNTPILQNNSQIFNVIYTYTSHNWSIAPYLQYTYIPANPSLGILTSAQTSGAAILTNYRLFKDFAKSITLPTRFEYISSSGKGNLNSPNLLYGPGSAAWSVTVTPTYQYQQFFVRGEFSYVQTINATQGQAFGMSGTAINQARIMFETGFLY
jgi:hypothetical protein